jgi:GPI-anchor transamidase subunit T
MPTPLGFAVALLLATATSSSLALHTEELYVRSLPHAGKTLAHLHFATHEPLDQALLSPPALRQILTKYDAAFLQLSFSVGHYDHARYGPPEGNAPSTATSGSFQAPFGARLQVAFHGDEATSGSFDDRWKGVTAELGGIFSASLNQMDETTVATCAAGANVLEFGLPLSNASHRIQDTHFFQATLAREELCTENLTPWLKMLPCRAHAGLGVLIDPIRILSGEYAMLSISASQDTIDGWRFDQHLTTVQPSPRGSDGISLAALLLDGPENPITNIQACPLATTSTIRTETGSEISSVDLLTLDQPLRTTQRYLPASGSDSVPIRPEDVVSVHRFQTGYGQVHGGLAVRLENRDPSCSLRVTYLDVSPWFMRLYFHSFQTRLQRLDSSDAVPSHRPPQFAFVPAELRGRPNQCRVEMELPPRSALVLSIQFDKVFVRLSEHPPDANRGFDIPSGVAMFSAIPSQACTKTAEPRIVYSEPLLVALPTPDFSMPYNVITLTSTVVAFFAGSMLNTLLRKAPRIQRMLTSAPVKTA